MATRYAEGTSVEVVKSRLEIEKMVAKHGGDDILAGTLQGKAFVQFRMKHRWVRLSVPAPTINDPRVQNGPNGGRRTEAQKATAVDAELRRRWRALVLLVKAKFTAIDDGITQFEEEFLAHVIIDQNRTVYDVMREPIDQHYLSGQPLALPSPDGFHK